MESISGDTMTLPTTTRTRVRTGSALVALLLAVAATLGISGTASAVTHASAASQFSAAGIGWTSSGGCSDPGNSTCTSFEGIRQATVDGAITLKSASGCGWDVTFYSCGC